jgi:hypothetical protein
MKICLLTLLTVMLCFSVSNKTYSQTSRSSSDHLVILWTSSDREVAETSCLMYAHAAKKYGWFGEVTLVIWGPSARLVVNDEAIRDKVLEMKGDGVEVEACVACSNMLVLTREMKALGIDVKGMGAPLSEYLKSGAHVLTY